MYSTGVINDEQRNLLKDMVIDEDMGLLHFFYNENHLT